MVDVPFVIRTGPSGPDMPQSTPHYVLTVQADGVSVKAEPLPTPPGGTITPLHAALVCDAAGTAPEPDGSWSGAQAFILLQEAIAALAATNGGSVSLPPGEYSGAFTINEQTTLLRGLGPRTGIDGSPDVSPSFAKLGGSIALSASDALCKLTLESLTCNATIDDGGTGADVALTGIVGNQTIAITGTLEANDITQSETVVCNRVVARVATFDGAFHSIGGGVLRSVTFNNVAQFDDVADMQDARFLNTASTYLHLGVGPNRYVNGFWLGVFEGGDGSHDFQNCSFSKAVHANGGAKLTFRQSKFTTNALSVAAGTVEMDAESELNALKTGIDIEVQITALSIGQGGDALFFNATATKTIAGPTRCYTPRTVPAAQVLTLSVAGVTGGEVWFFDMYATDNPIAVHDAGGGTIGPGGAALPVQAVAGTGTRYGFQVNAGATAWTYLGSKKL